MHAAATTELSEQWVGDEPLRFVAVYAASDVITRYEDEVQPSGEREQQTVG